MFQWEVALVVVHPGLSLQLNSAVVVVEDMKTVLIDENTTTEAVAAVVIIIVIENMMETVVVIVENMMIEIKDVSEVPNEGDIDTQNPRIKNQWLYISGE